MTPPHGMSWWLEQVGRYPLLSPAQELELARTVQAWRADPDDPRIRRRGLRAREKFAQSNLRLVVSVAKRFRRFVGSEAFDDLVSAGNIGLLDAVERFDPVRGYRFSTYACFWIQMRITAHLERSERTIRMPSTITYRVATIPKVVRRLLGTLGREPTRAELAAELKMSEEEVDRVFLLGRPCASLDAPVGSCDGTTLADMVGAPDGPETDEQVEQLRQQLQRLPARSRRIVEGAYGLGCAQQGPAMLAAAEGMTRQAVAKLLRAVEAQLAGALNPNQRQLELIDRVPVGELAPPLVLMGEGVKWRRRPKVAPDQIELVFKVPRRRSRLR